MLDFARQQSGTNPQLSGDAKCPCGNTKPELTRAQEGYPVKELSQPALSIFMFLNQEEFPSNYFYLFCN